MHTAPEGSIRVQSTSTWLRRLGVRESRAVLSFDDMNRRRGRTWTCAPGSADTAYLCGLAAYLRNPAA